MQRYHVSEKSKLVYLAGILDGEGCLNIAKSRTSFVPRIIVVSTDKILTWWLRKNFGGDVTKTRVKNRPLWKPRYTWRLANRRALELIKQVLPYLIIKRKQARVFVIWLKILKYTKNRKLKYLKYSDFENCIKLLNTKGTRSRG